ncbi:MAG: TldD/PmbA family protein [Oscillospiraceae bacterium]|nr:TldD/PmbA family protein [Oscillospiraceae bacterium]
MLQDLLSVYKPKLTGHTELRAQRNLSRTVYIQSGNVRGNSFAVEGGMSARVYDGGYWGVASDTSYDGKAIENALAAASRNAKLLSAKLGAKHPPLPSAPPGKFATKPNDNDAEQRAVMEFTRELDAYIVKKYPGLAARTVAMISDAVEKVVVTSDGADLYSMLPRATVYFSLCVTAPDGTVVEYSDFDHGTGFIPDRYSSPEVLFPKIDETYEKLMQKRDGVFPDAGICDVIIDSNLGGMLAHEAIGHPTEADLVRAGSVAGPNLGKSVASELISITDFANTAYGEALPQNVLVDDEGTPARDVKIIENGVLRGFMHSRDTARHFDTEPTGNARAEAFSAEPIVRMRNTAILPGNDKLQDMIASVDDGYFLTQTGNGSADLTSEFMFGVTMGYEIKKGKLGRAIRDTTVSGVAFDMLKTVTMVSDELRWNGAGTCGKSGQSMPVGMGGPSIKCKITIGGR